MSLRPTNAQTKSGGIFLPLYRSPGLKEALYNEARRRGIPASTLAMAILAAGLAAKEESNAEDEALRSPVEEAPSTHTSQGGPADAG